MLKTVHEKILFDKLLLTCEDEILNTTETSRGNKMKICDNICLIHFIGNYMHVNITGAQTEIFQGRGGLVGLGHFYKHFVKNTRQKAPHGKIGEFFLLDTLKPILNGKFNSKMDRVRTFFTKSWHSFFDFQNSAGKAPSFLPRSLVARLY